MNVEVKTEMNVKLLRQVKRAILAEPELYDQDRPPQSFHSCETPCCIFGWMGWIINPQDYLGKTTEEMSKWAGLTYPQFSRLYVAAEYWPEPFRSSYMKARSHKSRASVAAKRIDHFIATGGRE